MLSLFIFKYISVCAAVLVRLSVALHTSHCACPMVLATLHSSGSIFLQSTYRIFPPQFTALTQTLLTPSPTPLIPQPPTSLFPFKETGAARDISHRK